MSPIKKNVNGLKVHYYRNRKSKISSFGFRFCFGSRAESKKEYGLFHMLEHNIFKGTESFPESTEITRFFNERSFDLNAETSYSYTSYYAEGLSDCLLKDDILRYFIEMIFKSSFQKDEFEKERNPILNEYEMYANDTNVTFSENSIEALLGDQFHPILGTRKTIENISLNTVYKRYCELYNKENCVFIIETSKSWNKIEKELLKSMDLIPSGKKYIQNEKIKPSKSILKIKGKNVESGILSVYYECKDFNSIRDKTIYSLVLPIIEKLIYDQFRDREGIPTYSQSCRFVRLGDKTFIVVNAYVAPKRTKELTFKIIDFLKNIDKINWIHKINSMRMNIAKNWVDAIDHPVFYSVISNEKLIEMDDREERYRWILNSNKKINKNDILKHLKIFKKKPTIHYMT